MNPASKVSGQGERVASWSLWFDFLFFQSFPDRITNGVLDCLASRSVRERAVRCRFQALCCTEFGHRLTTVVYPSGSITEQLPTQTTQPTSSVRPTARRRRRRKGRTFSSYTVIAPPAQGRNGGGKPVHITKDRLSQ
jgi:hypothetical protein